MGGVVGSCQVRRGERRRGGVRAGGGARLNEAVEGRCRLACDRRSGAARTGLLGVSIKGRFRDDERESIHESIAPARGEEQIGSGLSACERGVVIVLLLVGRCGGEGVELCLFIRMSTAAFVILRHGLRETGYELRIVRG